jgi:hypothetical protein
VKHLVDIVNFNADGSCLSAVRWLAALQGGEGSELCAWLRLYVEAKAPVALGFIGGTLADVATLNPEAVALVNAHPSVFEVVLRPFAHDIALLRGPAAFRLNLELGARAIRRDFRNVRNWYLPPEFMLTNRQLAILPELGVEGVFINPGRFEPEVQRRLPRDPYFVTGVSGTSLRCIPFESGLTEAYLRTLQRLTPSIWNEALAAVPREIAYLWRDGESIFLVPDGIERERRWLALGGDRLSLAQAVAKNHFVRDLPADAYRSYPVHSFTAWMKEFRMLGYLRALERFEERIPTLPVEAQLLWLSAINSDVLSAVEKASPSVLLHALAGDEQHDHQILRTERGFEGEEFLHLLEHLDAPETRQHLASSNAPHMVKLRARLSYAGALHG